MDKGKTWNIYFMEIAELVASKSKDPRTKVGAVLVRNNRIISTGYNGFPKGIVETVERWQPPQKYDFVVHAERNALDNAAKEGISTLGTTLYITPLPPCLECVKGIISAGVEKVVITRYDIETRPQWADSIRKGNAILEEAGITVEIMDVF